LALAVLPKYRAGMSQIDPSRLTVGQPPTTETPTAETLAALKLALSGESPERQTAIAQRLARDVQAGAKSIEGLLAARAQNQLAGAILATVEPGRVGSLCGPVLADDAPEQAADRLLAAALVHLREQGACLAPVLLETDAGRPSDRLRRAGFTHAADLLYLVSEPADWSAAPPACQFEFQAYDPTTDRDRLARVVEATYRETRDCPALNGVRRAHDVIEGYAAMPGGPRHWFLLRRQGQDVGCLLLTDHSAADEHALPSAPAAKSQPQAEPLQQAAEPLWELVYMGVAAAARGRGGGLEIARFAQAWAGRHGGRRLLLAVDADNQPAIAAYSMAGFRAWDRRSVFLKVL